MILSNCEKHRRTTKTLKDLLLLLLPYFCYTNGQFWNTCVFMPLERFGIFCCEKLNVFSEGIHEKNLIEIRLAAKVTGWDRRSLLATLCTSAKTQTQPLCVPTFRVMTCDLCKIFIKAYLDVLELMTVYLHDTHWIVHQMFSIRFSYFSEFTLNLSKIEQPLHERSCR